MRACFTFNACLYCDLESRAKVFGSCSCLNFFGSCNFLTIFNVAQYNRHICDKQGLYGFLKTSIIALHSILLLTTLHSSLNMPQFSKLTHFISYLGSYNSKFCIKYWDPFIVLHQNLDWSIGIKICLVISFSFIFFFFSFHASLELP